MKKIALILFCMILCTAGFAQKNIGICGVQVEDVSRVTSFNYLVSYVVQFKNYTGKTVDGIYWRAVYYNNNNDLIKSEESSFNSTNIIDPIAAGFTKSIARTPGIKGASKVFIQIYKVHYSDGNSCN